MTFPHDAGTLATTFGYHPNESDLPSIAQLVQVGRLLVLGSEIPDVVDFVGSARFIATPPVDLPRGLYWFTGIGSVDILAVSEGTPPSGSEIAELGEVSDGHPLDSARGWLDGLWGDAAVVMRPNFAPSDDVVTVPARQHGVVRGRRFSSGTWLYELRLDGKLKIIAEHQLEPMPDDDDPETWILRGTESVDRFAATLTRAKLEGSLSDTMFSFRSTRTLFRPYQFKPVIKLLQTGKSRLLIADEVGLGKTIEAGLIWTELEARRAADRVLIVCPASLVGKWRQEMDERFNFELIELDGPALDDFEERVNMGRLPRRGFYVGSLERLRRWTALEGMAHLRLQFDLVIVDEAHYMRNLGTRNNDLGSILSEMSDNLVFLTATPLNLRSEDLYNLLDLLSPGEFGDVYTLDEQLAPNGVLHSVGESLLNRGVSARERLTMLDALEGLAFGRALQRRPEMDLLREVLAIEDLQPAEIVRAKRYLSDLNALSTTITRTRKVDVDEAKPVRDPRMIDIHWTPRELTFYREYLRWCETRARAANAPIGFAMQMPLRLASACLPAARSMVLNWTSAESEPVDEDDTQHMRTAPNVIPPHVDLIGAAHELGDVDTKFDRLLSIVQELVAGGKQTLLFTFSRPTLDYLSKRLGNHARLAVLHGGVVKEKRHQIISDFRSGAYDLVLANRVASEGLDFEFCSAVINYDLPWNPMEVEQRIGRIDRLGQKEERILVVNFHNEETIDGRILVRVMERIGVFERSIGALEPIIASSLTDLQTAMFDFNLTEAQREYKANQVLAAIEGENAGVEELSSASSYLLVAEDVDVKGMEAEILRTGRYVGPAELIQLISDWCLVAGAGRPRLSTDGRSIALRGNSAMANQVRALVADGRRTTAEVEELISQLNAELEMTLILDHELARTSAGNLLTSNHPLVLAALSVPGFQQAKFATIRVPLSSDVKPGSYFVHLGIAEWGGVRPGREIWGVALDDEGREAEAGIVERLLAALAVGEFQEGVPPSLEHEVSLAARSTQLLTRRQVQEENEKAREAHALLEARRVGLRLQHERKLESIRLRIRTAQERGRHKVIPLFVAQREAAERRFDGLMKQLESSSLTSLEVSPLAVCRVVIEGE